MCFGVAGVVVEEVDESFAAAGCAVWGWLVARPAEIGVVGAGAGLALESLFESGDAAVEVHGVVWLRAWRSSRRVVSSSSSA